MIIFHSGSTYDGGDPERLVPGSDVMLTFFEINKPVAKQDQRFRKIVKARRKRKKERRKP